ncbi:uncharacterized protein LOC119084570 isoform X2 [Bradysia coprophila]|uniref:uncharacterized protein LOC119084570 isoform X1 n=1 Tax=Bradysia coprophila TaxID=38358 RepID=UPI00187DB7D5|nr:uncharacterized protein LOC119084570 isoform X1 [Bradysia coprophila]XP_037050504.1 uncharacterized protein LOC119084570 isoform X2 [Bradysia coprophila]
MSEQRIDIVVEERQILTTYDFTKKLAEFRKFLIEKKYITIDADDGDTWRFYVVENGKATDTVRLDEEQYIPVSVHIYDTNKIFVGNLKKKLDVFADTLRQYFRFDVSHNLDDLRKLLTEKKFIDADTDTSAWRFVSPSAKDLKDITEAIIGIQSEDQMVVKKFLYGSNKVRLADIKRKKNPDLIGVAADYFENKDIQVTIQRNDGHSSNKIVPILMTNVRPANKLGVKADFSNVVLCEKETEIGIRINTKTHGGFGYSITVEEGDPIQGWNCVPFTGWTTWTMDWSRHAIVVTSAKDLGIPTQEAVGHRRVYIKVWRYLSYKDKTGVHQVDENAPKPKAMSILSGGIDVAGGDDVESGAFKEGEDTDNHVGGGWIADQVEDKNEILGAFDIDFFVFKTAEAAQNMVESRINPVYD